MVFLHNYQCPTSSKRSTFVELERLEMEKTIARLHSKHSPIQKPLILFLRQFGGIYIANKMETYPKRQLMLHIKLKVWFCLLSSKIKSGPQSSYSVSFIS